MLGFQGRIAELALALSLAHALLSPRCWAQAAPSEVTPDAATLALVVSEASALVSIDGAVKGVTPLEAPLGLPVGRHRLELFKAGFQRIAQDIELVAGAQSLSFELRAEPTKARLNVGASSLPATLLVDGQEQGALPGSFEVTPGEHTLSARGRDAISTEQRVTVLAGETAVVTLAMQPRMARLQIHVTEASIFVDGKWVGVGDFVGPIAPGHHHVRLKRIGYSAKEFDLTLRADEAWNVPNIDWGSPNASESSQVERPAWAGVYAQLGLVGLFGPSPTDELKRDCPAARQGGSCAWHRSYGGGLALRVGYSFGWFALEGLALGAVDAWYDEARYETATTRAQSEFYGPARSEQYTFVRYGGGLGIGTRLLSPTSGVRATLGVAFGVLARRERYLRVSSTVSTVSPPIGPTVRIPDARADSSKADGDTSALLLVDAGVLFGSTPGLKLHVGALLAATFGSSSEVPARHGSLGRDATGAALPFGTGAIDISRGSQVFFGPILGVQFGH
jgi:hypothetical protein